MMVSKSDIVRKLLDNGDYKKALGIVKGFRIGLSKEALNKVALAYEVMIYPKFYAQLGVDIENAINEGKAVLNNLYGQSE